MIILTEVAKKLEKILNGTDTEVGPSGTKVVATNPTNYNFVVKTEGFHIDSIAKEDRSGNFIPVFVSSMGGQFNPVKGLKQGSYSIPIAFYYPVRFKDDFFALGDFLVDAFVGTTLNYGSISGVAVSNISVPQYGEIQNLDFKEFEKWVTSNYEKDIKKMEDYMVMNLNLYLSSAASGFIYGNDIQVDLSITIPTSGGESKTYTLEDIDWDGASLQSNTQPSPEQEEGTNEASAIPFGTSYGSSFKVYPNLNAQIPEEYIVSDAYDADAYYYRRKSSYPEGVYDYLGQITEETYDLNWQGGYTLYTHEPEVSLYKELLKVWLNGNIQELRCTITFTIAGDSELVYTRNCFIQSIVSPIEKGQLFALTLTFSKVSE